MLVQSEHFQFSSASLDHLAKAGMIDAFLKGKRYIAYRSANLGSRTLYHAHREIRYILPELYIT